MKKACFFARVSDQNDFNKVEFYATDIEILNNLGFEVFTCTKFRNLKIADLFFVWWWTWAFFPILVAKLFKKPIIITGTFNLWLYKTRPWYQKKLIDYSVRNATVNIVVSVLEYRQLKELYPDANIVYSPHVLNENEYSPSNSNKKNFIYTTATMVQGNAERKCIPELIEAAVIIRKMYPDIVFILAGKCDSTYKQYANKLGASEYIKFPGEISKDQKIQYLRTCLIYAQPSRFEGFGVGLLEAILCGAPVVASRVGAVEEVLGEHALYVDGLSAESIAAGIKELVDSEINRLKLSQLGRLRALELFTLKRRSEDINSIVLDMF